MSSTQQLRLLGATCHAALCVIDRTDGDRSVLDAAGITLIPLFTAAELA